MKWYTLAERPIKEGESGLFYAKDCEGHDGPGIFIARFSGTTLKYGQVQSYYYSNVKPCCRPEEYTFFRDIIGWIPLEELEATLPKDNE